MNLGLKRGTVKLFPHEKEWETEAQNTIYKLSEILGSVLVDISHVGSTSIKSIKAKPIIDIAVAVNAAGTAGAAAHQTIDRCHNKALLSKSNLFRGIKFQTFIQKNSTLCRSSSVYSHKTLHLQKTRDIFRGNFRIFSIFLYYFLSSCCIIT